MGDYGARLPEGHLKEVLSDTGLLPLGERVHRQRGEPPGESLRGSRQSVVAGRSSEDEPAGSRSLVELGLDGLENDRRLLVFVDAHQSLPGVGPGWIGTDRLLDRRVVEVDDLATAQPGHLSKQRGLAHGTRTFQQNDRGVCHE